MTGHGSKFGCKKEDAIVALLSPRRVEEAARVAGIGTKTRFRWLRMPEFQAAYRQARRQAFSQSLARLQPCKLWKRGGWSGPSRAKICFERCRLCCKRVGIQILQVHPMGRHDLSGSEGAQT